jgi:N-acetylmuramoyl-L-alanine amidase-like protein
VSGQNLYFDLAGILTAAGCRVQVGSINAGWEHRARSSGGFPQPPLAVFWHHTASSTSVESDLSWMIDGCDDAPVGNLLLDRDGVFWPIAAGASNCAGKGGPSTFSRGTIGVDAGNTGGFQIEVANGGTGEPWPQVQIDAYFAGSNALNAHVGNQPGDVITHHVWAPTRKIDPATGDAVQGPWRPAETTSSGTWSLVDIATECAHRAGHTPTPPTPIPPDEEDDMKPLYVYAKGGEWIVPPLLDGPARLVLDQTTAVALKQSGAYVEVTFSDAQLDNLPAQ